MTPGDGVKYGNEFFYGLQPPCCAVKDEHCEIRGVKESKLRGLDAGRWRCGRETSPGGGARALAGTGEGAASPTRDARAEGQTPAGERVEGGGWMGR